MEVPPEDSGKSAFSYHSTAFKELAVDYLGNKCTVEESSFVHAEPIAFSLSIAEQYKLLLKTVRVDIATGGICSNKNTKLRKVGDKNWAKRS